VSYVIADVLNQNHDESPRDHKKNVLGVKRNSTTVAREGEEGHSFKDVVPHPFS